MSQSTTPTPTIAFTDTHKVELAPLACPFCRQELRAVDVQLLGDDDECCLACAGCHRTVLTILRRW